MTQVAWALLAVAAAFAVTDWIGVARSDDRLRRVGKPGALLILIGVALTLQPVEPSQRDIFAAALFLSFLGDVYLLLRGERWFLAGLVAFLGAHLAYIDGFLVGRLHTGSPLLYAGAAVSLVSLAIGARVVIGLLRSGRAAMAVPVVLYLVAITAMVTLAGASGRPLALAGALVFYASDGMIAWNRYVSPLPWAGLPIIVTYHLGQAGLTISLATAGLN